MTSHPILDSQDSRSSNLNIGHAHPIRGGNAAKHASERIPPDQLKLSRVSDNVARHPGERVVPKKYLRLDPTLQRQAPETLIASGGADSDPEQELQSSNG